MYTFTQWCQDQSIWVWLLFDFCISFVLMTIEQQLWQLTNLPHVSMGWKLKATVSHLCTMVMGSFLWDGRAPFMCLINGWNRYSNRRRSAKLWVNSRRLKSALFVLSVFSSLTKAVQNWARALFWDQFSLARRMRANIGGWWTGIRWELQAFSWKMKGLTP